MLRKTIFGVRSDDGFRIRLHGRNSVRVARGKDQIFAFIEPLATTPTTYQLDTSGVWRDEEFSKPIKDAALTKAVIGMVIAYFALIGVGLEVR